MHGRRSRRWRVVPLLAAGLVLSGCSAGPPARPTPLPTTAPARRPPAAGPHVPAHATHPGLPTVVHHGRRDSGMVALTFDSNMTDAMLAELDRGQVASFDNRAVIDELVAERVAATFFLAGKWIERYPDDTRRIVATPLFEVGSHSYAHRAFHLPCYGLGGLRVSAMAADVARSEALLRRFTPHPTNYFRFPGGCYDQAALRAVAPTHVQVIQYDVASGGRVRDLSPADRDPHARAHARRVDRGHAHHRRQHRPADRARPAGDRGRAPRPRAAAGPPLDPAVHGRGLERCADRP